jgi:EmrB/QacA subfamily drug resistance transporter
MTHITRPAVRSRWLALVVLCAGMLMIILDQTIVTVALPSIQHDLGFSQSGLAWVVNSYVIPFGGLLLLFGRLGDLIGRARVFVAGLVLFTVASLACGWAGGPAALIVARFVQGIGGAMTSAVVLGMIVPMFPEPRERAKAIAVYSFVGSAGASIGFVAGGLLTEAVNWHWIFFVNVPIGAVAVTLALRLFPAERRNAGRGGRPRAGADVTGAVLVTAGLMVGVYAIVRTGDYGWGSPRTLGLGAAAVVLLGAFLAREATATDPLLPLRVFRSRNVSAANVVQMLMVAGLLGYQFLNMLYLQRVLGYGPARAGLAVVPTALAIGILSLGFSARLNNRFGPRAVLVSGLALIAAGLVLLARVPVSGHYLADILPGLLLLGTGGGLALPPVTALAMSDATAGDSGTASGLVNTTQQVGAALGLAGLATVAGSRTDHLLAAGEAGALALTGGYRLAFFVSAGAVAAALLLAAGTLRRPPATDPVAGPDRTSTTGPTTGPIAGAGSGPTTGPIAGASGGPTTGPIAGAGGGPTTGPTAEAASPAGMAGTATRA